jgi:DNA polymerase-3 subunit alpha
MYSYEKFYDHFCIKEDNKIITHVDTEAEAKKIIFELNSENVDIDVETIKNIGKNYTVYHLHTMYSLLDSTTSFEDYVDMAKSYGMTAIGCSEHGNIYGWYKKKMYAEKNGLKFLFGIECYLTETFDEKIRDNYHTILIAKNKDGMHEICRLFFNSTNKQHTYYKPRLSFDEFLSISNNVIKISACIQSPLSKYMLKIKDNHTEEQKQMIIKLLRHYDYYEIQYHNAPWQIEYNRYLYTMSKRFHKPLIVGTDTHSLNDYKAECRTILQYGKTDGAWGDEENDCDLTFKSYNELVEMFRIQNSLPMDVVLDAIENTNKMANSVEEITFNTDSKYPLLYGEDDEKMLWKTLKEKYNEKVERGEIDKNDKRYISAIKEEMSVFKKINMIGFMLFMSQIGSWAKENHIAMGFARGSCFTKDALVLTDNASNTA